MRLLIAALAVALLPAQSDPVTAFIGVTIVDGTGAAPVENGVVLVRGGRVTAAGPASRVAVPADAIRIDLSGRTLLPGFINTVGRDAPPLAYARYGVTSVFPAPAETTTALDQAKQRLNAGARFLPRGILDRPVDFELVQLARARDACVASMLIRELSMFVYETTPSFFREAFYLRGADPDDVARLTNREFQDSVRNNPAIPRYKNAFEQASRNLKQLKDAGVRIALGTDSGAPGRFAGAFEHLELELMVKAGLTPMQAIVAATGDAARCMAKTGAIGTIQPGAAADLVVYDRSPAADIRNSQRIESVWVAGARIDMGR